MKSNILLVDDELECLHTMALVLTLQGHRVKKITDAESALHELMVSQSGNNHFDLLITDIEMPQIKGDELIEELRNIGITIPTIVLTGYGNKELLIKLMRKGCTDYIDKPVTPENLIKRVSLVLNQAEKNRNKQEQSENLAELGTLANEFIHDINNMLCTIYGFADLAQNQFTSNKVLNNYLSKICKSTTYVSKLTSQLLSLSQRKKINFCELNLSIEIIQWLDMLKIAAGKNISLKVNAPPDIPEIIADQTSIEQLLMKLVINSRNIMPQGGELTISVKEVKEETENSNKNHIKGSSCISLSFTYSCPEIDNETFRQLSQPYITLISKNDRISRSLSTIKKIIHDHKGKIDIINKPNNSYVHTIIFPIA